MDGPTVGKQEMKDIDGRRGGRQMLKAINTQDHKDSKLCNEVITYHGGVAGVISVIE